MAETSTSSIRERGEVTIPKKIREAVQLEPGERVEFIPIGSEAVLLTPKRLELNEARRQIRGILKRTQISPQEVLAGLEESRQAVYQKHFGAKRRGK